jgi:N-methylhydantoinase A
MTSNYIIGVDVGGTYTDVFALDEATGAVRVLKLRSTRPDQSVGFLNGLVEASGDLAQVSTVVHGTTVATNALLERKIAKTGVITTRGFRDVLEMRRRDRPNTWGLTGSFTPVVERDCRLEVDERVLADGSVHTPVNIEQVLACAAQLIAKGCEALSLFFLHSYANASNEMAALEALRRVWPNAYISASHQILPEIREFERASTTTLNAALQPVVAHYLNNLDTALLAKGFSGQLLVVQSNGGVMDVATASSTPVRTALSGPAAGVVACAQIAVQSGFPNVITGDMGGTSFDVSLVANGNANMANQLSVEFGLVIRTPMVEIQTIGAGGGSIASVDASGFLQVGPQSAGSDPGPVCFALGNQLPTVTDANLVLGRINPQRAIGSAAGREYRLDVDAARVAIDQKVAQALGLSIEAAAEAILTVANAKMAGAIRLVSIERGVDPQAFAYMPFGGGGALHVCAMMREVGCQVGLVPRFPGVTSALGCVIADMRHDFVQTLNKGLDDLDMVQLQVLVDRLNAQGQALLKQSKMHFEKEILGLEFDMLYQGQTHAVQVPIHLSAGEKISAALLANAFDARYAESFGRALVGVARRVLNLRLSVTGVRPKFDLSLLANARTTALSGAVQGAASRRSVWHAGRAWDTPVYQREALGQALQPLPVSGPLLVEQSDTTIWVEPGFSAQSDALGNLLIRPL